MTSASEMTSGGYQPGSPRQRLVSTLLSGSIITVVVLLAIYQTQVVAPLKELQRNPVTFDMKEQDSEAGKKEPKKAEKKKAEEPEKKKEEKKEPPKVKTRVDEREVVVPPKAPVPVKRPDAVEPPPFNFQRLSKSEMAAADIGAMKPPSGGAPAASSASTGGGASSAGAGPGRMQGPGEGPGGAVLYNAEWHRRPTSAELGGYLPKTAPRDGWGLIACQTLDQFRVDNCQILGESPRGSGFGRAALNAAWQFQIKPPRVDGKVQIGAWVRIRIDYQTRPATPL